jgi:hypothetical protein
MVSYAVSNHRLYNKRNKFGFANRLCGREFYTERLRNVSKRDKEEGGNTRETKKKKKKSERFFGRKEKKKKKKACYYNNLIRLHYVPRIEPLSSDQDPEKEEYHLSPC